MTNIAVTNNEERRPERYTEGTVLQLLRFTGRATCNGTEGRRQGGSQQGALPPNTTTIFTNISSFIQQSYVGHPL